MIGLIIGGIFGLIIAIAGISFAWTRYSDWTKGKGRSLDELAGDSNRQTNTNSKSRLINDSVSKPTFQPDKTPTFDRHYNPALQPQRPTPPMQAIAVANIPQHRMDDPPSSPTPTVISLTPSMSASMVGVRNQPHPHQPYSNPSGYYPQSQYAGYSPQPRTMGAPLGMNRVYGQDRSYGQPVGRPGPRMWDNRYGNSVPSQGQVAYGQITPQQQYAERFSSDLSFNRAPPPGPISGNQYHPQGYGRY
ncbi:hypothetical protein HDU67_002167 [Dinochytrium kinnereticum]|nr:hypothetical protein HDU67_002167 [Dinochytrium kinnereticum]